MTTIAPYSRVPWAQHLARLNFRQGEHILICGPNGSGKTTLVPQVAAKRGHVVAMVSKLQKDETFAREYKGWHIARTWPPPPFESRVLLWPRPGKTIRLSRDTQKEVFQNAFDDIGLNAPGWCIVIDESHYMTDNAFLNLGPEIAILHHQGRSAHVSVISLSQRPAWIPKIVYSSVVHAYIARTRDADDLKRLSDFGGIDSKELGKQIATLPDRHDFMYLNPQGDIPPHIVNTRQ